MKTILNENDRLNTIQRINRLTPESKNLWGRMNVNQMLCHVTDQIRMAIGEKKTKFVGNPILKTIVKWLVLGGLPIPKGKVPTADELNQEKNGTQPVGFLDDLNQLIKIINEFENKYPKSSTIVHPAFGPFSMGQWGRLIYLHLDHHLRQFGV
jgi:hypothetical protein